MLRRSYVRHVLMRGSLLYRCLPIVAALLLAGCAGASTATDSPQARAQSPAPVGPQQQVAAAVPQPDDDAVCRSQGYQPGSDAYVQCRKQLDTQHLKDDPQPQWTAERENTVRALLNRPPAGWGQ
jgi:hypothetical protein